jgi:O-antigen ligase
MLTGIQASYIIGTSAMVLAFFLLIIFEQKIFKPWTLIFLMIVILAIFQSDFINLVAYLLEQIVKVMNLNSEYETKIEFIKSTLLTSSIAVGSDFSNRLDLYLESIKGFFDNPLFGSLLGSCGGHSTLLDSLARFGMLGTFPWIMIIYYFNRQMNSSVYKNNITRKALNYIFLIPWVCTLGLDPATGRMIYASFFLIIPGLSLFIND